MNFLEICGVLFFVVLLFPLYKIIAWPLEEHILPAISKYNNYCYLKNLGVTEKEFNDFIKGSRQDMDDEQYLVWRKENIRFLAEWIPIGPKKKKSYRK